MDVLKTDKIINRLINTAEERVLVDAEAQRERQAGFEALAVITERQGFVASGLAIGAAAVLDCMYNYHYNQSRRDLVSALAPEYRQRFGALLSECMAAMKKDLLEIYTSGEIDG